jgi:hypothetical protein
VWTSSLQDCSVLRVNAAGTSVTRFDYQPWANPYGCLSSGLAVDNNNHLWITSRTDPGFVIRVDANYDNAPILAIVCTGWLMEGGGMRGAGMGGGEGVRTKRLRHAGLQGSVDAVVGR